jgi:hypothetical protein
MGQAAVAQRDDDLEVSARAKRTLNEARPAKSMTDAKRRTPAWTPAPHEVQLVGDRRDHFKVVEIRTIEQRPCDLSAYRLERHFDDPPNARRYC